MTTFVTIVAFAQLPKWVIPPVNDTIFVKLDNKLLQSEKDGEYALWGMRGGMIFSTEYVINPFNNGVATFTEKGNEKICGFVDENGKIVKLRGVEVSYNYPFFEDGFLLGVNNGIYTYYDKNGVPASFDQCAKAYPFHKGYSSYLTFENFEKKKDPYYEYNTNEGRIDNCVINDNNGNKKVVDNKNIQFLSSIGDDNRGIAVIKNKLYWFRPETKEFYPMLWGEGDDNKKRHLNLDLGDKNYLFNLPIDTVVIPAKYGDNNKVILKFNNRLLPIEFISDDGEQIKFSKKTAEQISYISDIAKIGNKPYGLSYRSEGFLPNQFEAIGLMYDNKAIVKKHGKWGLIEIDPDLNYSLKINKGEDIAFRHQKFETQIRLDLPAKISAKEARIDISEGTGCVIDKTSRVTKDTESGNFVTYNCILNIPESLPDTITTITYNPIRISYDDISLKDIPVSVKAWHLKYYNVDPIESETSITNGIASFTINVNAQRNVDESDYPFDIKIDAPSIAVELEKISETRYKCMVSNLKEGENTLNILVEEKGCPPSVFPFEIFYSKPVPKKKKKEEVIVRKKSKEIKKNSTPLEI